MEKLDIAYNVVNEFIDVGLIYGEPDFFFEALCFAILAVCDKDEMIALPESAKEDLNRLGVAYQEKSENVYIRAWDCANNIESLYEYIYI